MDDVQNSKGEELPYLDAKTLRGKSDLKYLKAGKIVDIGTKVILVDGENSGEVFDVPFAGYMGSTFKVLGASINVNLQYLNLILDSYRDLFRGNKIGAAIPHLNKHLFKNSLVGLPPTIEQKRIVDRIKELEPLIAEYDKCEKANRTLDEELPTLLRKSILQYAIQGKLVPQDSKDEPASVLLERIRAERAKSATGKKGTAKPESIIYKNSDDNSYYPFDIPESWEWCCLEDICDINPRIQAEPSSIAAFIPMKLIDEGFGNSFTFEKKSWGSIKDGFTQFADGDVGFAKITPCFENRKSVVFRDLPNGIGAGTTELHILRPHMGIIAEYLLWLVKSPYFIEYGEEHLVGTAGQQRFQTPALRTMPIPLPPYNEQKRIVNAISEMIKIIPNSLIMRK